MKTERATYSYSKLNECVKAIKTLNMTVNKKSEHGFMISELKKVYDLCFEKTDCILFDAEYTVWSDYAKAFLQKDTKRVLDDLLRRNIRYLQYEINAIYRDMQLGEVNAVS